MIRVLHCVNNMHRAGLETMLMNYYRNIDRSQVQFDFLTHRPYRSDYDDEIESLGGRVYYAPRLYPHNYPKYFAYMKRFFKEHPEYRIVHSHIDAMSYLPLLAAKKAHVPIRIAHSHSTSIDKDAKYLLKKCFRAGLKNVANYRFACGDKAGQFLFCGDEFEIVPNAIDIKRFSFSECKRNQIRKELEIEEKFVVGHVGRFSYPKNHKFLIDIFNEVKEYVPNSVLLLIGDGEKKQSIEQYAKSLKIEQSVRFLGNQSDTSKFYQAMDAFVLPSFFEGIPVVGIEAQYAALPCFFSDQVPDEVVFTDRCSFVSLDATADQWAKAILKAKDAERSAAGIMEEKYNIEHAHRKLSERYLQLSI